MNKEIGNKIKQFRKAINMTTTELGTLSGTSQSSISQIENGRSTNIENLIKICEALKISIFDVLPADVVSKEEHPEKNQLIGIISKLTDSEVKLLLSLLATNIIPAIKSITPLIDVLDQLNDQERKILADLLRAITKDK